MLKRVGHFTIRNGGVSKRLPEESNREWKMRNHERLQWFDGSEWQIITIL
jgi:hypothetical protein